MCRDLKFLSLLILRSFLLELLSKRVRYFYFHNRALKETLEIRNEYVTYRKDENVSLNLDDVLDLEEIDEFVKQFLYESRILEIFREKHNLIAYLKVLKFSLFIVRMSLRSTSALQTSHQ